MEKQTFRQGVIDTDILVDASRGFVQAGEFLNETLRGTSITISAISAMELIAGCRDGTQLANVKQVIGQFNILPLTEPISMRAQVLMETFTLSHGLFLPDALIAATAIESGIALYTRNVRHFRMLPDLLIIQPY